MKILIIITFSILLLGLSCSNIRTESQSTEIRGVSNAPSNESLHDGFQIIVIDGCEYIIHTDRHFGHKSNTESMVHKGNCSNHKK